MANLEVQESPVVNTSIDVPSVLHDLNTNTGPQAQPISFGADMNGLVDGMNRAGESIYRAQREADMVSRSADETWAAGQHAALDKQFTALVMNAQATGKPIDPDALSDQFDSAVSKISDSAPSPYAALAFQRGASMIGDSFYRQNLAIMADQQKAARTGAVQTTADQIYDKVRSGLMPAEDGFGALLSLNRLASPSTPEVQGITNATGAKVAQAGIVQMGSKLGPTVAAAAVRNGYGDPFVQPVPGEILATNLDNQARLDGDTRLAIAQQKYDAIKAQAASGQAVSPAQLAAVNGELTAAQSAKTFNSYQPDLTEFIQGQMDHYAQLEGQIGGGPGQEGRLQAMRGIEDAQLSQLIFQRMSLLPPDQQAAQIAKMENTFGPENSLVKTAKTISSEMASKLSPGEGYDPAGVAMQVPAVQTRAEDATKAQSYLQNPTPFGSATAAKGYADAQMNLALQTSYAAQRAVGVSPGQEMVLTRAQADQYASQLKSPQDYQNVVKTLQSTYGNVAGPDGSSAAVGAIRQVFDRKGAVPGAVQLALLNPSLDNWGAASFVNPLKPDDPQMKLINQEIVNNSDFRRYFDSNQNDPRMATQRVQWTEGAAQMAAYHLQTFGGSPHDAVQAVFDSTIGSKYRVVGTDNGRTLSIPSEFAASAADASTLQDKANVALAQLQASGAQIGQSSNSPSDPGLRWHQAATQGYWNYDDGAKALVRYQTGPLGSAPYLLADGRPVAFTLAGLKSSNVVASTFQTNPRFLELLGDATLGRPLPASSEEKGPSKLDVDLNSIIPAAPASSRPFFPLIAPPAAGSDAKTGSTSQTSNLDDKLPDAMKGLGPVFEKYGAMNGVDPALLAAISMHETGRGTSRAFTSGNNAMGISTSAGPVSFDNVEDSIAHQAFMLGRSPLYASYRKSGNIADLGSVYAPVGAENDPQDLNKDWVGGVSKFYEELR